MVGIESAMPDFQRMPSETTTLFEIAVRSVATSQPVADARISRTDEAMTNSEALVQSDRWIPYAIRSSAARILFGWFLFFFRLSGWIRVSLFEPVLTELSLRAVRFDHAIRDEYPMERHRFISFFGYHRHMFKNRLIVVS